MVSTARIVGGYWGMGDNVMRLPLVKLLTRRFSEVFLATPWPQLYWQFYNLHFLHPAGGKPRPLSLDALSREHRHPTRLAMGRGGRRAC